MLLGQGCQVRDCGTEGEEAVDYPDIAATVASAVACGEAERGVLFCGTGIGMSIAANKIRGVRAALAHDAHAAQMARLHNDANVVVLRSEVPDPELRDILRTFMETSFEGGRHARRVDKIKQLETDERGDR